VGKRNKKGSRIEIFYVIILFIKNTTSPIEGVYKLLIHNISRFGIVLKLLIWDSKALKTLIVLISS
jgi:hypothetical protein